MIISWSLLVVRSHSPFVSAAVDEPNHVKTESIAQYVEVQSTERIFSQEVMDGNWDYVREDESCWRVDSED